MSLSSFDDRLEEMYRMLLAMAMGEVSFRIAISEEHDAVDAVSLLLNQVADLLAEVPIAAKWQLIAVRLPLVSSCFFRIDEQGVVCYFSRNAPLILDTSAPELMSRSFVDLLASESHAVWHLLHGQVQATPVQPVMGRLVFRHGDHSFFSVFCCLMAVYATSSVLVSFVSVAQVQKPNDAVFSALGLRPSEVAALYAVRDFILENWDAPLPSVPLLARTFFIEEHKLKQGFRALFSSSVYHFYLEQRLQQAHHLLQYRALSLKAIGYQCGYDSYYSFYRAFKKRFGYAPSAVVRLP